MVDEEETPPAIGLAETDPSVDAPQQEQPPPQEPPQEQPQQTSTRSPEEWRNLLLPVSERGTFHKDAWKHGAASALHGWALHEMHANEPMQLSQSDYEAALEASTKVVDNTYQPHPAALSPYAKPESERT